jgi:hypothetical protein
MFHTCGLKGVNQIVAGTTGIGGNDIVLRGIGVNNLSVR